MLYLFFFVFFSLIFLSYSTLLYSIMQHVTAEGTALVKQAEDAASNKKVCIF